MILDKVRIMRIDIDSYREILDTLTRNKSRSFLTGFGVFWGVFMLVALIGGGQGLKEMLQENFAGFATNSAMVWAQPTSKAYKGFRKGRYWHMDYKDVERIKSRVPELDVVTPLLFSNGGYAYYGDRKAQIGVNGALPDYQRVNEPKMFYGRYINEADIKDHRKVCVIQKKTYKELFPGGGDPCGKSIRIDSIYYQIVGVDYNTSEAISFGGEAGTNVVLPLTLMQQTYNRGNAVDMIAVTGKKGVVMSSITDRIRETIARAHLIDPTDERGAMVFNTEVLFQLLDNLFKGVNFLIWLVGLGTLLAGAIGVSNIMMVTVRERTTEIGIRRAIGATPTNILSQIISESIVLTLVAGMSGILFGVMILHMLELANTEDGILAAHFQVGFWTAIFAAFVVSVMGVLAGLAAVDVHRQVIFHCQFQLGNEEMDLLCLRMGMGIIVQSGFADHVGTVFFDISLQLLQSFPAVIIFQILGMNAEGQSEAGILFPQFHAFQQVMSAAADENGMADTGFQHSVYDIFPVIVILSGTQMTVGIRVHDLRTPGRRQPDAAVPGIPACGRNGMQVCCGR